MLGLTRLDEEGVEGDTGWRLDEEDDVGAEVGSNEYAPESMIMSFVEEFGVGWKGGVTLDKGWDAGGCWVTVDLLGGLELEMIWA